MSSIVVDIHSSARHSMEEGYTRDRYNVDGIAVVVEGDGETWRSSGRRVRGGGGWRSRYWRI